MLTAELTGPREFRFTEQPIPDPCPGEVQVRVAAVGICGSDLHNYLDGRIGDTLCVYPMVLGHEPAGIVVQVGSGVTGWAPGDRAAVEPAIYCYHCEFCRTGRHNLCSNIRFQSMPGIPGFFREFANVPAGNLLALPERLGLEEATVFEPLAVVLHSLQLVHFKAGETAAVFGAGPVGLLTVAALKLAGAGRVWAVEPIAHRRDLACRLGADAAFDPNQADAAREIVNDTAGRGVDVTFDCAAMPSTMNQCMRAAASGGRVALTGIPSEIVVNVEFHVMRRKELSLYNVRRSNHDSELALRLLAEHPQRFAPLLTHRRKLEEVATAFQLLERYDDGVGKVVIG